MKFSTREEINVPIDQVFAAMVDFETMEERIVARGGSAQRLDDLQTKGPGMAWDIAFTFKGASRQLEARVAQYKPYERIRVESTSDGLDGEMICNLSETKSGKTQLNMSVELKPKTLSARLLVQSMKLAKATMNKRFKNRIAEFGREIEANQQRAA